VIGDSITAANYFPTLCGKPALNAGISWSTSHDWAPRAAELVRRAQPSVVILALGNNDARPDWHDDYRKLARYAFFAVTPKQPEKAAFIRTLVSTVPVPDQTYDGTHLTTVGAREWVRRIDTKCAMLSAQQTDKAKMLGTSGAK
jgi:lysophospholipase L1-like esterase